MNWYVGQEIVCVKSSVNGQIKTGDEFVINAIRKPCCTVVFDIGLNSNSNRLCSKCGYKERNKDGIAWYAEKLFAPKEKIGMHTVESLMQEIEVVPETV